MVLPSTFEKRLLLDIVNGPQHSYMLGTDNQIIVPTIAHRTLRVGIHNGYRLLPVDIEDERGGRRRRRKAEPEPMMWLKWDLLPKFPEEQTVIAIILIARKRSRSVDDLLSHNPAPYS